MRSARTFLPHFMVLAILGGITISTGKIVTTLFALHLGATGWQLGLIGAVESAGMALVTLPAGWLIARYGARRVYFLSSLGPLLLNLVLPWVGFWYAIAAIRAVIGLCIPFRIVSMNSAFLERLADIGHAKAGWYRASQSIGMGLLGPSIALTTVAGDRFVLAYVAVAAGFAALAVYGQWVLPERMAPPPDNTGLLRHARELLRDRDVAESCSVEWLASATQSMFSTFIVAAAIQVHGLGRVEAVQLLTVQGMTNVAALFGLGALCSGLSRRQGYGLSLGLAALSLILLGFANGFFVLALGTVLLCLGSAINHLINMRHLGQRPGGKSQIASLYNLAGMAGNTCGALLGGLISTVVGLGWLYPAWLPCLLIMAGLIAIRSRQLARQAPLAPQHQTVF
ncbi:MFS transporter [Chitinimonas sp. BJYL2]|uniref:MFS transporter n=1 Tax=Chitinimonas sp. BJYL2 TaxID=2976696 RepID=UPI0022B3B002|nr:MFS transporter [Chitinimonas sp. BJYL2]